MPATNLKNNIMKKLIVLVLIACFMFSCKSRDRYTRSDIPAYFPLKQSELVTDFNQYVDSVEVIPLEVSDSSYISYIKKVLIAPAGQIVILNSTGILVFDPRGQFLFSMGQNGRGPGEYLQLYDICLNDNSTEVLAIDCDNSVSRYALSDGHFIEKIIPKFPQRYPNCIGIAPASDGGFFLFACNPFDKADFKTKFYCLNLFDKKGKHIQSFLPRKKYAIPIDVITQSYDNTYLIRPQEGDNVCYRLKGNDLQAIFQFDFEDEYVPSRFLTITPQVPFDIQRFVNTPYYKLPLYLHETTTQMYFSCGGPEANDHFFIFDKNTFKSIHWIHDKNDPTALLLMKASDKNFFYGVFSDYNNYDMESIPKDMEPLKKFLIEKKGINLNGDSMNPSIVKIKFNL